MKLLGSMTIQDESLCVSGVSYSDLAREYGTPLYVIDQENFERTAQIFLENFKSQSFSTHVIYASKAFTNLYIANLAHSLGLYLDVVSGGELYTALEAGYDPNKIYFHGNNKLYSELEFAIENNIGTLVVDNEGEFEYIKEILECKDKTARVLLRINPVIQASTHEYIQTTTKDSKFGMLAGTEMTNKLIRAIDDYPRTNFAGIHCHIGSQVLDEESFFETGEVVLKLAKKISNLLARPLEEVNLGGGFGVYYTHEDKPLDYKTFLPKYINKLESIVESINLDVQTISIEPGRAMINESGSTLYEVGQVKAMEASNDYVFVNGGMTDNPRPALYQAKYEASLVEKISKPAEKTYTIAGKCCESGDILIKDIDLPQVEPGDLLVIPSTGAYNYSMSSNYNRIEKPAVVFVKDGNARLAVRRENYEDLIRNDIKPPRGE